MKEPPTVVRDPLPPRKPSRWGVGMSFLKSSVSLVVHKPMLLLLALLVIAVTIGIVAALQFSALADGATAAVFPAVVSASGVSLALGSIILTALATAYGGAALVAAARHAADGEKHLARSAARAVSGHAAPLAVWALIGAAVMIPEALAEAYVPLGSVASWAIQLIWTYLTFLAVPAILFEDRGAIAGLRRSVELLHRTWVEQIAARVLLFLFLMVVMWILSLALLAAAATVAGGDGIMASTLIAYFVLFGVVTAFTMAVETALMVALYRLGVASESTQEPAVQNA